MSDAIIGKQFGRLTVLEMVPKEERIGGTDARRRAQYRCICICGNKLIATTANLTSGRVESCGCLRREAISKATTTHGLTARKHGEDTPRLYHIWKGMKQRCFNRCEPAFKHYGARGIIVCAEWSNNYEAFHSWAMAHGYRDDLSIDRIDVDGNYEPSNCRWATAKEQANNKRIHKHKQ